MLFFSSSLEIIVRLVQWQNPFPVYTCGSMVPPPSRSYTLKIQPSFSSMELGGGESVQEDGEGPTAKVGESWIQN